MHTINSDKLHDKKLSGIMKAIFPISQKTFEERTSKWLKIIARGESICVIFCPKMDRHRRWSQLFNDKKLLKKYLIQAKKYTFLIINFDSFPIEEAEDLGDYIASQFSLHEEKIKINKFSQCLSYLQKKQQKIVLVALNAEKLLLPSYKQILFYLASMIENQPSIQCLLFFECNLMQQENLDLLSQKTAILQNIIYYPLYDLKDVEQFINYLSRKWNLTISRKMIKAIIQECGSHFLLIKEAVRFLRDNPKASIQEIFDHEQMKIRLSWIYNTFTEGEKEILKKTAFGKTNFNKQELQIVSYLQNLSILNKSNQNTIPLFNKYLQRITHQKSRLTANNGEIFLNNFPIKIFFSRQEFRVLQGLLKRQGELLTRDEIASLMWLIDTDKNYSDWAIDQLIKRLRKKITKIYISPKSLKTIRGQGYLLLLD